MIHVITAVHNRYQITKKFVGFLNNQSYKDIHLVVVDDGSDDNTSEMVTESFNNSVTIIHGNGDLWWGGALHEAYKWVKNNFCEIKDDYIMFANDDTEFDQNYIQFAVDLLKHNKDALITGCGYDINKKKLLDGPINWDFRQGKIAGGIVPGESGNCASTRSLFFRVIDFVKIGGFHPILLPHYASDYEWTIRACNIHGYKVISNSSLKYYFDEHTTGNNDIEKVTLKQVFSKRSNMNPFYKISFILLSTPKKYIIFTFFYQFKRYMHKNGKIRKIVKRKL